MAKKEKVENMGKAEIALAIAQLLPWEKIIDKAPEMVRVARGMLPSFKWKNRSNNQQQSTIDNLSESIGQLEAALEEQARMIESMTEQSAGMIVKIKELDEANQKLVIERDGATKKLNIALGLSLLSLLAAATAVLR